MQQNRNNKAAERDDSKKRQLADDIFNDLLTGRDRQQQPKPKVVHSPQRAIEEEAKVVSD